MLFVAADSISGNVTRRIAYALKLATLPAPDVGFEWREDREFNAAEAVLAEPELKSVFSTAKKMVRDRGASLRGRIWSEFSCQNG